MSPFRQGQTFSFKFTVVSALLFIAALTTSAAIGLQYYFSLELADEAAQSQFAQISEKVSQRIQTMDRDSYELTELLNQYPSLTKRAPTQGLHQAIPLLAQAMRLNPNVYAIYIGYENGDFYELINLDNTPDLRTRMQAEADDRWLVIRIEDTRFGRERIFEYYDESLTQRAIRREDSAYRANERPWFKAAQAAQGVAKTGPYLFHNLQAPGITYSRTIRDSQHVIAVDLSLASITELLKQQRHIVGSELFLFDDKGNLSAHSYDEVIEPLVPKSEPLKLTERERVYLHNKDRLRISNEMDWPPYDFAYSGRPEGYSVDVMKLISHKLGIPIEFSNGMSWAELVQQFESGKLDALQSILYTPERESWGLFSSPIATLPTAIVTKENVVVASMQDLDGKRVAIPQGWALESKIKQYYPQIELVPVSSALEALHVVARGDVFAAIDSATVVNHLIAVYFVEGLRVDTSLLRESPIADLYLRILVHHGEPQLLALFNRAIAAITAEEREQLKHRWLNGSDAQQFSRSLVSGVVPHKGMLEMARQSAEQGRAQRVLSRQGDDYLINVSRIDNSLGRDHYLAVVVKVDTMLSPYLKRIVYSLLASLLVLALLIPVVLYFANMIARPIRSLAGENQKIKQRRFDQVVVIRSQITELDELSASMFDMAGSIQAYQQAQQELMDAFIKLIAQAIDEKSPYTGGHCARVPELAVMLAQAASASDSAPFRAFSLRTDDEWREFKIASWLHDCGKVTTPEHVVDKGSKLETIYNRIHEIRTRFEVLWRDAELAYWRGLHEGEQSPESLAGKLAERQQQIRDDFAFVAECNVGSEFMDDAAVERIKQIAQQTWVRHLDNRLGLSPVEQSLCADVGQALPATEPLLADRPEHHIPWVVGRDYPPELGIKMQPPALQANLGEVYNLCIQKGTLTTEDRFRINEHIISTIRMLETLPLPHELAKVPEYAGGHHETLIGTGYPKQLSKAELSIPARILAIADIFEALTASDRPYKPAKSLDEALRIMEFMVKDQHIDADLYALMVEQGIHLKYAERFLG